MGFLRLTNFWKNKYVRHLNNGSGFTEDGLKNFTGKDRNIKEICEGENIKLFCVDLAPPQVFMEAIYSIFKL